MVQRSCILWRPPVIFICCLAFTLLVTTNTQAFYVTGAKWDSPATSFYPDSNFTSQNGGWNNSAFGAAADWNYAGAFQFAYTGSQSNIISAGNLGCGDNHALAGTSGPPPSPGPIPYFTIVMNVYCGDAYYDGTQTPTIPSNYYDLGTVLRHEMGHAIGICHQPDDGNALMYNYVFPGVIKGIDGDASNADNYLYQAGYSGPPPEVGCP